MYQENPKCNIKSMGFVVSAPYLYIKSDDYHRNHIQEQTLTKITKDIRQRKKNKVLLQSISV